MDLGGIRQVRRGRGERRKALCKSLRILEHRRKSDVVCLRLGDQCVDFASKILK